MSRQRLTIGTFGEIGFFTGPNGRVGHVWEEIDGFPFELALVEGVTVTDVEVDESTVQADLLDTVSDTGIWDVRASAQVHLEGKVYRGDTSRLDPAWSVSFGAIDDRSTRQPEPSLARSSLTCVWKPTPRQPTVR